MASLFYQLVTIILVTITLHVLLVKGQANGGSDGGSDDEGTPELSNLQKIINAIIKYRAAQKERAMMMREQSEADFSNDGYDDDRQSRSNLRIDGDHLCMVVKIGELNLGTNDIAYKPSVLEEFGCDTVHERNYGSVIKQNRMLCYVRGNSCENSNKIIPVSVYKREKGKHCWSSETRNISVGCNCHFPTQHLGYKPYRPGR